MPAPTQTAIGHGNSQIPTFGSATAAGSLLWLAIAYDRGGQMVNLTGGGTWIQIGSQDDVGSGERYDSWYLEGNSGGVTALSPTVNGIGVLNGSGWVLAEFPGVLASGALRASDAAKAIGSTTTATDAETSNSITPTAGDLVVASYLSASGTAPTISAGTGFTLAATEPGVAATTSAAAVEWQTAAGGSQIATFTQNKTGDSYVVQVAAFVPAATPEALGAPRPHPSFGPF